MATRRLRFTFEQEATVEIDEERLLEYIGDETSIKRIEKRLREPIEEGDATIDSMASAVGIEGTYDKYVDTRLDIEMEQQCPKHPDIWFPLEPTRMGYCWMCKSEQREAKEKKA